MNSNHFYSSSTPDGYEITVSYQWSTRLLLVYKTLKERKQLQFGFNIMLQWHSLECFGTLPTTTQPCEKARASDFETNLEKHCFVLYYFISPRFKQEVRFLIILCLDIVFFPQGRKVTFL